MPWKRKAEPFIKLTCLQSFMSCVICLQRSATPAASTGARASPRSGAPARRGPAGPSARNVSKEAKGPSSSDICKSFWDLDPSWWHYGIIGSAKLLQPPLLHLLLYQTPFPSMQKSLMDGPHHLSLHLRRIIDIPLFPDSCHPGCFNGGRCVGHDKCSCPHGFGGPSCQGRKPARRFPMKKSSKLKLSLILFSGSSLHGEMRERRRVHDARQPVPVQGGLLRGEVPQEVRYPKSQLLDLQSGFPSSSGQSWKRGR